MRDGTLWNAGMNRFGGLCRNVADGTSAATNFGQVPGVENARQVSLGNAFAMIVMEDGTVWTAGSNNTGQLARTVQSGTSGATNLGQVPDITSAVYSACGSIPGGENNNGWSAIVLGDGTLLTAGSNASGQLARTVQSGTSGATNLGVVKLPNPVSSVACGAGSGGSTGTGHIAIVLADGTFYTAGANAAGELCRAGNYSNEINNLAKVGGVADAVSVTCCRQSTVLVRGDGSVWSGGTRSSYTSELPIKGNASSSNFAQIMSVSQARTAVGSNGVQGINVMVIMHDGTLWMGGDNRYGQLCRNTGNEYTNYFDAIPGINMPAIGGD